MPTGLFDPVSYETVTITLEPEDAVLFCSDGITEAFNAKEEAFGMERVREICETGPCAEPGELLGRIFAAVQEFTQGHEQHDDMTAAVLRLDSRA